MSVDKSRQQIHETLVAWGATHIQWEDDLGSGDAVLRFRWPAPGGDGFVAARLNLRCPDVEPPRTRSGRKSKVDPKEQHRRRLHRVVAHWLKNHRIAIEEGLFTADEVMLPWIETANGATVAEALSSRILSLASGDAAKILQLKESQR